MDSKEPLVGIVMGSDSDWPLVQKACATLDGFGVPYETRVISAHRTPDVALEYSKTAESRGIKVIIAAAGGAAHLGGVLAAGTVLPVIGIPVAGGALNGLDALYATVQMPSGVPVATVAVGSAGPANAALLAVQPRHGGRRAAREVPRPQGDAPRQGRRREREDPCVGPRSCWRRWPPPASCARRRRTSARAGSPSCRSTRATPRRSQRTPPRWARRRSSTASPGSARCIPRAPRRRTRARSTPRSTANRRRTCGSSRPSSRACSCSRPSATEDGPRRRPRPSSSPSRRTPPPRHGACVRSTARSSTTSRAPAARSTS